jgi:hypothetical protein
MGTANLRPHYNWQSWIHHYFWAQISISFSDRKSCIFKKGHIPVCLIFNQAYKQPFIHYKWNEAERE